MSSNIDENHFVDIVSGISGYLRKFDESTSDSVLILQMPCVAKHLYHQYADTLLKQLKTSWPDQKIMVLSSDVNLYELCGEDISILKLKGAKIA